MKKTEIKDWQFGQLNYADRLGWCAKNVEWIAGQAVELCIQTELNKNNTIPKRARTIFNNLRDRENEFKSLTTKELLATFNEIMCSDDDSIYDECPFNTESFINLLGLCWVYIDTDGESELQYMTYGGPLLRVIVSSDLSFKEALFD